MQRMEWLDDGETIEYGAYLLDRITEIVETYLRKNNSERLYSRDIARAFRDINDVDAALMLEEILTTKRDVRGIVKRNAEAGLNLSDRAEDVLSRVMTRQAQQDDEITRLAESE